MKLTKRARKALEESVEHWKRMRDDKECVEKPSSEYCSCCDLFYCVGCVGCPIAKKARRDGCNNTPYGDAVNAWDERLLSYYGWRNWRRAAKRMISFMQEILDGSSG